MTLENLRLSEIKQVLKIHGEEGVTYSAAGRKAYGLSVCESGEIVYNQNGNITLQKKGCAVLLPQNAHYKLKYTKTGDFPLVNFYCSSDFTNGRVQSFDIKNNDMFLLKFSALKKAYESGQNFAKLSSLFYDIVSDIIDSSLRESSPVAPAIKYIGENYTLQAIDNKTLSSLCGISEVYMRKQFKKACGVSPKQYILNLKLQKAKSLLCESNRTVTEISDECGFSSVYHFCRIFKEKTGTTPSEYKKSML